MQEQIKNILIECLLEDETFCECFCKECGAIAHYRGDYYNPPETYCPSDFAIGEPGCARVRDWLRIENAIEQAAEIAADACIEEDVFA